ncbi:SCO family protein [Sorangium sp. So ce1078]|uniref:SCO family protein n=1 Tax=Sorangium sp. So ce1078 TaxID=3133329 RepID=UPI003F63700D
MSRPLSALLALLALVVATATPARSARAADTTIPTELVGVDIEERPGAMLPRELRLRDQSGQEVELGRYAAGDKPLVLVLGYYECPMLCSLVLNGVLQAMKESAWSADKEYRTLVVSFDPRDTPDVARKKRANYIEAYGRPITGNGFDFLVGDEASVRTLANTVGFGYRWDETTEQYAHAAGAFVFTPDGRLSRTLYGISFPQKNFGLALREAGSGLVGSAWDRVLLFCFHYDPNARGYVLATRRLMMASGALTVVLIGLWLMRFWRIERTRTTARVNEAS